MIKLKKINKCFNFEAFFQFLKNGLLKCYDANSIQN